MLKVQLLQAVQKSAQAMLTNGSVVTWGYSGGAGDSGGIQEQLNNVEQIKAAGSGFSGFLDDGSFVAWGSWYTGHDWQEFG